MPGTDGTRTCRPARFGRRRVNAVRSRTAVASLGSSNGGDPKSQSDKQALKL